MQSAVMAGLKVVSVKVLPDGSLDIEDLREKAQQHKDDLAAFMVSYPATAIPLFLTSTYRSRIHRLMVCSRVAFKRLARSSMRMEAKSTWTEQT